MIKILKAVSSTLEDISIELITPSSEVREKVKSLSSFLSEYLKEYEKEREGSFVVTGKWGDKDGEFKKK